MISSAGAIRTEGPWKVKLCASCGDPRNMPEDWRACPTCVAGGAKRGTRTRYLVRVPGTRRRRQWLGMVREDLEDAAGLTTPTVRKAERGEPVTERTALKIARALDTTVEEISRG